MFRIKYSRESRQVSSVLRSMSKPLPRILAVVLMMVEGSGLSAKTFWHPRTPIPSQNFGAFFHTEALATRPGSVPERRPADFASRFNATLGSLTPLNLSHDQRPLYSRFSRSFIKKVTEALIRQELTPEAEEFARLAHSITGFMRYDPRRNTYTVVHVDEWKRFAELARLSGHPLGYSFWKGMIWEERLHALFSQYAFPLSLGGRHTNIVYFLAQKGFGQRMADEFGLANPKDYEDESLLEFTHELYAKFWLSRILPGLDPTLFGFAVFKGFEIAISPALEGSLILHGENSADIFHGLLSLLTPEERKASGVGHNFKPGSEQTPEEVRRLIDTAVGPKKRVGRSTNRFLSRAAYRDRLNTVAGGLFLRLSHGQRNQVVFKEVKPQKARNEITDGYGKTLLVQMKSDWPETDDFPTVVDYLAVIRRSFAEDLRWAETQGYTRIVYLDAGDYLFQELGQTGYQEMIRIAADVLEQFHHEGSLHNIRDITLRIDGMDRDFRAYRQGVATRHLKAPQGVLPANLRGGDIVQIHSPLRYHQRAVLLKTPAPTDNGIILLPIHYWGDNFIGFLESKGYLKSGYDTAPREYSMTTLVHLGLHIEKEPVQEGEYAIKIGEKIEFEHQGAVHRCTVIGIAHGHYIFVMDEPLGKDLGGFALYVQRDGAAELLREGTFKRVEEWNLRQPAKEVKRNSRFGPPHRRLWRMSLLVTITLSSLSPFMSILGGVTASSLTTWGQLTAPGFLGTSRPPAIEPRISQSA